jgi:hypothetical protein
MEAIFGTLRTVTSLAAGTEIISDYPIPAGFSILLLIAGNETAITISEQTAKLVEGYFQLNLLGPARIKGVTSLPLRDGSSA